MTKNVKYQLDDSTQNFANRLQYAKEYSEVIIPFYRLQKARFGWKKIV